MLTAGLWNLSNHAEKSFALVHDMSILNNYQQASTASGRSLASLIFEATLLRLSPTKLGLSEYIDFQLYKTDIPWSSKSAFGGQRAQAAVEEMLIDDYSRFLSLDKVTMYALLSGLKLPIPEVRATYRSIRPSCTVQLHTPEQLIEFLSRSANLPIYIKRSFGSYGRGNVLIKAIDGNDVILGNGDREPVIDFCNSLDDSRTLGWILQDPLSCHQDIQALTASEKVSGLRIHTFLTKRDARITKAIFKINAGHRDSDNFEHGASGNMLAAVDIKSGTVVRAISGVGLHQKEIPRHPKTNGELVGFRIPNWDQVVALVTDAQKAFPGFICPGWDIALCADGPKILEVNAFGDIDLSQHAYRKSFFDEDFLSCLKDRGLDQLLHSSRGKGQRSKKNNRVGVKRHHWLW